MHFLIVCWMLKLDGVKKKKKTILNGIFKNHSDCLAVQFEWLMLYHK